MKTKQFQNGLWKTYIECEGPNGIEELVFHGIEPETCLKLVSDGIRGKFEDQRVSADVANFYRYLKNPRVI